jgi:hypothetical protein
MGAFKRVLGRENSDGATATLTAAASLAYSPTATEAEAVWESEGGSRHANQAGADGAKEPA